MKKLVTELTLSELNSRPKWCDEYSQSQAFLNCAKCELFPCSSISNSELRVLMDTPLVLCTMGEMIPRRRRREMKYILEDNEGDLTLAPKNFNINKPSQAAMRGITAVHEIKKTYEPTFTLKPKTKTERDEVLSIPMDKPTSKPKKRGRPKATA